MRARKKLLVFLFTLAGLVALSAGGLYLMFPGSHINRIKKNSPIYIQAVSFAPQWEQRVRDAVLQQLPIGSTPQQIQAFLQQHFVHVQYRVARSDDERTDEDVRLADMSDSEQPCAPARVVADLESR